MTRFRLMLELTDESGRAVWVSPPHVAAIRPEGSGAELVLGDGKTVRVTQRAETVVSQVESRIAAMWRVE